jgi:hypothetical protein
MYCERCVAKAKSGRETAVIPSSWTAWCATCEEENEELLASEDEAKAWKNQHRCYEWDRPEPDVTIEGPVKRALRKEQYDKAVRKSNEEAKIRNEQQKEMDRLVTIGMIVDTARKSWWRRLLLRLAGV